MLIFGDLTLDFNSNSTLPPKKTVTALFCLWRLATVAANQGKPEDGSGSRRCSRDWQSNTLFLFSATKMAQWFNLFEKYVRQIGSFPQVRVKIKNIGNHHPDCLRFEGKCWSLSTQSVDRVDGFHSRIPQIQDYSRKIYKIHVLNNIPPMSSPNFNCQIQRKSSFLKNLFLLLHCFNQPPLLQPNSSTIRSGPRIHF